MLSSDTKETHICIMARPGWRATWQKSVILVAFSWRLFFWKFQHMRLILECSCRNGKKQFHSFQIYSQMNSYCWWADVTLLYLCTGVWAENSERTVIKALFWWGFKGSQIYSVYHFCHLYTYNIKWFQHCSNPVEILFRLNLCFIWSPLTITNL